MIKSVFIVILLSALSSFAADSIKPKNLPRKPASAPKSSSYFIGHNLTPSTDEIRAGSVTVGNYALGYAVTDNLLLATSPWIWTTYNTQNLHLKYTQVLSPKSDAGFMLSYFNSYDSGNLMDTNSSNNLTPFAPAPGGLPTGGQLNAGTNRYQWTSYSAHALYGYRYDNSNVQYVNLKYSNFVNDEMPYSLRMDPGDDSIRNQIDASTLLKIPTDDNVSFGLEAGILGLNYINPYTHLGASIRIHESSWMLQLGASYTVMAKEFGTSKALEIGRWDNRVHYSEVAQQYYSERYLQVAVHPEVQFQIYF